MTFYANIGDKRVDLDTMAVLVTANPNEASLLQSRNFIHVENDVFINKTRVQALQSNEGGTQIILEPSAAEDTRHGPTVSSRLIPRALAKKIPGLLDLTPNNEGTLFVRPEALDAADFQGCDRTHIYFRAHLNDRNSSNHGHLKILREDAPKIIKKLEKAVPLAQMEISANYPYWINAANVEKAVDSYRGDGQQTAVHFHGVNDHPIYIPKPPAQVLDQLHKTVADFHAQSLGKIRRRGGFTDTIITEEDRAAAAATPGC